MSETTNTNFISSIISDDLESGKHTKVTTRFPPEPNGYLHIGHAKSICLNYGMAQEFNGQFHLRFDDTNPSKEEVEYVESIKKDVEWLGAEWGENLFFASDYFDKFYACAVKLIKDGKAYVCDLSAEETREYRGTLTVPGKNSPFRDRSIEENLELLQKMKDGEIAEGAKVLRAKIDMADQNIHMRDPIMYRIQHTEHHRTGAAWNIYPMYDFAHPIEDALESITHSICTLEFEIHRPLYNWFIEQLASELPSAPRQIEFARLNLGYTVMSKRRLLELVQENHVNGWDDPRMPTVSGMRRRGITPESIHKFCSTIGVTKFNSMTDPALLEFCIREDLNTKSERKMAVLDPLKVVITNYPEEKVEEFDAVNNPENPEAGKRKVKFSRELYIERSDYMENAPRKFFRLTEGKEVRFKYAYLITCNEAIKDEDGNVVELHCTVDLDSSGGSAPDGRKVKGTIHWVSASHSEKAEIRLYDRLFSVENPDDGVEDYKENINPDSLKTITAYIEESLKDVVSGATVQFERNGYFCVDPDSEPCKMVLNRTVALRNSWEKIAKKMAQK